MTLVASDHGAVADGTTLNTTVLQKQLDACAANGGGIVRFPAGRYLTGSLVVGSFTTIELEPGAVLVGSADIADYAPIGMESERRDTALLFAHRAHDVTIRGGGTIDGNGDAFFDLSRGTVPGDYDPARTRQGAAYADRPDGAEMGPVQYRVVEGRQARPGTLVLFVDCEQVRVEDITIVGSPNWCLHLAGCRYANLRGLFIRNSMLIPNADCIDIANSSHVNISDCVLEAGDDGIAITPCADGYHVAPSEHINVTNCTISSRSAGIRVGYGLEPVRNVHFSNIHIYASNRGIGLFVRNGQIVENVTFTNVTIETRLFSGWWGAGEPIHLSVVGGYAYEGALGYLRNVRFQNVYATGETGIVLFADDHDDGERRIENVEFENLTLHVVPGALNERYGGNIDLRPAVDPARRIFAYELAGILARNVDGLALRGVEIRLAEGLPDYLRRGLALEQCRAVRVERVRARRADGGEVPCEPPLASIGEGAE